MQRVVRHSQPDVRVNPLVELRGIEPLACTLRTYRSTN